MFDYIIVGAGFAGSIMSERIATKLNKKVLLVEKRNHIGGNCYDYRNEENILVHKYGPHYLHTDNKNVFEYLSQFTEWNTYQHEAKAMIDGKLVPIPFNLNTLYELFPESLAANLEEKLLAKFDYNSNVPVLNLKKSRDKDLKFLANYIYENLFVNYTKKQWGLDPKELDESVINRLPIFIGRDNSYFKETYQGVPKNGYTALFEKMLDHPNIKLMLNTDIKELMEIKGDGFYFMDNKFEGQVIYTGQVDRLFNYCFGELDYRSVDMEFKTLNQEQYQVSTSINYPNNYQFTRVTEFKHMYGTNSARTTILKEYPTEYIRDENIPYYPVLTKKNQKIYQQYEKYAKQYKNLILLGRLAEYKYYEIGDVIEEALSRFQKGINNKLTMIVATHKAHRFPQESIYIPMHCGKAVEGTEDLNMLGDDTGDNISLRNRNYSELSGLYWAWKNDFYGQSEYCGLVHYRRHFKSFTEGNEIASEQELLNEMKECDILLPTKAYFNDKTVKEQYCHFHHCKDLENTRKVIEDLYPEYLDAFDEHVNQDGIYLYNIFIMKPALCYTYCKWLFDILLELERRTDITSYTPYQARIYSFLSERLFNVWLDHHKELKLKERDIIRY